MPVMLTFTKPVGQSIHDIAVNHFLMAYLPKTSFNFLFNSPGESSPCLNSAARAVALANLARQRTDGELMHISRIAYAKAVRQLNLALNSKEVSNSTIAATSILGLFEALAMSTENSLDSSKPSESWIAHTNGTLSLIKYRGTELLQTTFGKELYIQAANKYRINCTAKRMRLSSEFLELDKKLAPLTLDFAPNAHFWPLIDKFNEMFVQDHGKLVALTFLLT
jgi:Fungal specific transcription factor domain